MQHQSIQLVHQVSLLPFHHVLNIVLDKGVEALKSAKRNHMILEKAYNGAIDFSGIDDVKEEIYKEILAYI